MSSFDTCTVCSSRVAGDGPAVGVSPEDAAHYIPFVEDLRTSSLGLRHVRCFIEEQSFERFLDALHEHDEWVRASLSEYHRAAKGPRPEG